MDITTDGSIHPKEALKEAAEILIGAREANFSFVGHRGLPMRTAGLQARS